jgi:hypothetical protein
VNASWAVSARTLALATLVTLSLAYTLGCASLLNADFDRSPASGDDETDGGDAWTDDTPDGMGGGDVGSSEGSAFDGRPPPDASAPDTSLFEGPPDGAAAQRALSLVEATSTPASYNVWANIFNDPAGPGSCTFQYVSGCQLSQCMQGTGKLPPNGAGTIHVTAAVDTVLAPMPDSGVYNNAVGSQALWSPGSPVHFTATGGDVPGFDETLVGPDAITLTAPPLSGTTFSRSQPLTIQWTGGAFAARVLMAIGSVTANPGLQALCWALPSAGQGSIDPAVLQLLPPGQISLSVAGEARRQLFPSPTLEVHIIARSEIITIPLVLE